MKYLFFLLGVISLGFGQTFDQIIRKYQESGTLANAQWSISAKYVDTKESVISYNANWSLSPASGLKLFTAATALGVLGKDFHFTTQLLQDGAITNGVLKGNIIIQGGGDPSLGSSALDESLPLDSLMDLWAVAITKAGITRITGDIVANISHYEEQVVPAYWNWLNLGNYFATGAGAINISDNLYYLVFQPGKVGWLAKVLRTEPEIPGLTFTNYMLTGRRGSGDNGYIYCAPKQYDAVLRGSIPAGRSEFKIKGSIPDPALFCAQYLKTYLEKSGIEVSGNARTDRSFSNGAKLLSTIQSPALSEILKEVLKNSNNLYAEAIGKMAGNKSIGLGSNENTVKAIEKFLDKLKIKHEQLDLYDACGLSPVNLISAEMMTELLIAMRHHPDFDTYYNSMAVAGNKEDTGSFNNWGSAPDNAKEARIKSGLIKHVRSHSGYVKDKKGRLIAFSFIANNFQGSYHNINTFHKQLLIKLAELE